LQGLVRGHAYFTRLFVTKSRTFHRELPVGQADAPFLRSVPPNVAATLARRARPSNLLSTQTQDRFDRLPTDAVGPGVISSTNGSKICPFAFANSSILALAV
jgi:hypothetical protein